VKSRRHVVAVGDLDATETVGPMTPSERCRARPGCTQVIQLHVEHLAHRGVAQAIGSGWRQLE
jgi:hypothetical protein